jgi:diguanylate cyclase (GGDEF)-like protein
VSLSPANEAAPRTVPTAVLLLDAVGRARAFTIVLASLTMLAMVSIGDYLSGSDLSFSAFYQLPVVLAASSARTRAGVWIAVVTAVLWSCVDVGTRPHPYPSILNPVWNTGVRFLVFALVIALLDALKKTVLHERVVSREDDLSGLPNSRAFYEFAEIERRRLARHGGALTVAYLDVDDFKGINDTLGHSAGDDVLRATADVLRSSLREVDLAGRLGGDEFAVILPDTDAAGATVVLDRLHVALGVEAALRGWPIGFSIGSVTFLSAPPSVDVMISKTDRLMYEVKRAGKNALRSAVSA